MYCLPCPNNTYPSMDGSKCLPCNDFEYNSYIKYTYSSKYYARTQNHCLYKNAFPIELDNPNITFFIKYKNQNIDSYYFRNELQSAKYFCKVSKRIYLYRKNNNTTNFFRKGID